MKPKTLGNKSKGIVNKDFGHVSQINLPKTMGNDTVPCSFVYVIAPIGFNSEEMADIRDIETKKRYQELGNDYYFVPLGIIGVIQGNWGVTRNNCE